MDGHGQPALRSDLPRLMGASLSARQSASCVPGGRRPGPLPPERVLVAMLAQATCWSRACRASPKTLTVKTLAAVPGPILCIQFTPDLVLADLIGTCIYNQEDG